MRGNNTRGRGRGRGKIGSRGGAIIKPIDKSSVDPDSNQNLQQFKHGANKKILMYNPN